MSFSDDLGRRLNQADVARQQASDHEASVTEVGGSLGDPAEASATEDYQKLLGEVIDAIPDRVWRPAGLRKYQWPDGSIHVQDARHVETVLRQRQGADGPHHYSHKALDQNSHRYETLLDKLRNGNYETKVEAFLAPIRAAISVRQGSQEWVQLALTTRDSYGLLNSGERVFLFRDGSLFLCTSYPQASSETQLHPTGARFTPGAVPIHRNSPLWVDTTPLPGRAALLIMVQACLESGGSDDF